MPCGRCRGPADLLRDVTRCRAFLSALPPRLVASEHVGYSGRASSRNIQRRLGGDGTRGAARRARTLRGSARARCEPAALVPDCRLARDAGGLSGDVGPLPAAESASLRLQSDPGRSADAAARPLALRHAPRIAVAQWIMFAGFTSSVVVLAVALGLGGIANDHNIGLWLRLVALVSFSSIAFLGWVVRHRCVGDRRD